MGKSVAFCKTCHDKNRQHDHNKNLSCATSPETLASATGLSKRSDKYGDISSDEGMGVKGDESDTELSESSKSSKRRRGPRGKWSAQVVDDFIDIVANNDIFKRKLIFTNTKNQQNGPIYEKILVELKERCSARGENIHFKVAQMRTKFKKCVGECKKAALTIKTATGIKRFLDDKGYGAWFQQLFELVKTRDSCDPEKAIEPSALGNGNKETVMSKDDPTDVSSKEKREKMFVPVKSKKQKKDGPLNDAVNILKQAMENDPSKHMIELMKDEMQKSREHELKLFQMICNTMNTGSVNQQFMQAPQPFQAPAPPQQPFQAHGYMNTNPEWYQYPYASQTWPSSPFSPGVSEMQRYASSPSPPMSSSSSSTSFSLDGSIISDSPCPPLP